MAEQCNCECGCMRLTDRPFCYGIDGCKGNPILENGKHRYARPQFKREYGFGRNGNIRKKSQPPARGLDLYDSVVPE